VLAVPTTLGLLLVLAVACPRGRPRGARHRPGRVPPAAVHLARSEQTAPPHSARVGRGELLRTTRPVRPTFDPPSVRDGARQGAGSTAARPPANRARHPRSAWAASTHCSSSPATPGRAEDQNTVVEVLPAFVRLNLAPPPPPRRQPQRRRRPPEQHPFDCAQPEPTRNCNKDLGIDVVRLPFRFPADAQSGMQARRSRSCGGAIGEGSQRRGRAGR
jgi:hypothetical protein